VAELIVVCPVAVSRTIAGGSGTALVLGKPVLLSLVFRFLCSLSLQALRPVANGVMGHLNGVFYRGITLFKLVITPFRQGGFTSL